MTEQHTPHHGHKKTPYVPSAQQWQIFTSMTTPRTINVNWQFTADDYHKLQAGFEAKTQDDKWYVFMQNDVLYFHRSWTGAELFRLRLQPYGAAYGVTEFMVEQNPERYNTTDQLEITSLLLQVIQTLFDVRPQIGVPVQPPGQTPVSQTSGYTDVWGIVSIVMFFVSLSPVGIVLGLIGEKKAKAVGASTVVSRIGWIVNLVATALFILIIAALILVLALAEGSNY